MDYFRWQPAPSVPAILLGWRTMEGIQAQVAEGVKAVPRRGAEVGGALLGHRDPVTGDFTIDGFEPVPIEHESGPSYVPSERDLAVWRERVGRLREATPGFIGVYRSQTRPGILVTPEDCAMIERFLPRQEGVLLLVKPLSAAEYVGAFFLCDGGAVLDEAVASRQFPFGKTQPPARKVPKVSVWLPATAAAFGIALAFFIHYRQDQRSDPDENPVAEVAPANLHLRVEPNGSNARVAWDAASSLLDGATGATLNVSDGHNPRVLRLTSADLRNGYIEWPASSRDMNFALSIDRPGQPPAGASVNWKNARYPINSPSDTANPKPSPLTAASPQTDGDRAPAAPASRSVIVPRAPLAAKTLHPGRVKRIVDGITSKASHLWPFHSAKPARQTQ